MLNSILTYKAGFLATRRNRVKDIASFIIELVAYNNLKEIALNEDPHWNNYFHASLVSAFQECTSYDLTNWNDYFSNSAEISASLDISLPNEGQVLELFVIHSINRVFSFGTNDLEITALKSNNNVSPNYLTDDSNDSGFLTAEENTRIINNLKVVMKMRGRAEKRIWGDNDIVVILNLDGVRQQFCIISCKTSLRERVYQSIFWAMHSRMEGVGKHVFVTTDKGASGRSEIGNRALDNSAKKSRDVLESTMDRVYVLRNPNEVNRSQVIKDFTHLREDLLFWAKDIAGH